jgi:hypothetical protein
VDQDRLNAEEARYFAGMLPARAAEARESTQTLESGGLIKKAPTHAETSRGRGPR